MKKSIVRSLTATRPHLNGQLHRKRLHRQTQRDEVWFQEKIGGEGVEGFRGGEGVEGFRGGEGVEGLRGGEGVEGFRGSNPEHCTLEAGALPAS